MTEIQKKLFSLQDTEYKAFQAKVVPNIAPETIIGVRVPQIRAYAKELWKNNTCSDKENPVKAFLETLPHQYYEENLLHGFLLEFIRDFDEAARMEDLFIPYIDNWAVCDTTHPKIFKKHTEELLPWIRKWLDSRETYSIRYGINVLMSYYLDDYFKPEYLEMVSAVQSEEYYVNMMKAWFFATALAKQWDSAVEYIENRRMDSWSHNKTIQKAVESFRVSPEHKEYLKSMRIK